MAEIKIGDLVAVPAYGRIYDSESAVQNAWNWGQDFRIVDGPYFSIRDLDKIKKDYNGLLIVCPLSKVRIRIF